MLKSKKLRAKSAESRWPDEKELKAIRDHLSSDQVEGSTVLGPDAPLA